MEQTAVDLALLEMAANGGTLDAGQAALVCSMATSGARLQLAIAPAGTGKTTALQALTRAWLEGGGQVMVGPVRRRRGAAPRPDRGADRHAGQTHRHCDTRTTNRRIGFSILAPRRWC